MSIKLPEGIYPGCSAISGIAQPGGGMWVNVPGVGSSVRAIASNKIDSQTNLTVTVDRDGAVRVFGVGERSSTLERTTEFRRNRTRTRAIVYAGNAAAVLQIARTTGIYPFAVNPGINNEIGLLVHTQQWLIQPNAEPYLLLEYDSFPVGAPTNPSGAGQWGMANLLPFFYISINESDRTTIHVDCRSRIAYGNTLFDLEAESLNGSRVLSHWQSQNGVVSSVATSEAWRADYMNTPAPNPSGLSSDPCVNAYALSSTANLGASYRYNAPVFPSDRTPEVSDLIFTYGVGAFLVVQPAAIDLSSYILARDSVCSSNNLEPDRKAFVQIEQLPPSMRSLSINSFDTPGGDTLLVADRIDFSATGGLVFEL